MFEIDKKVETFAVSNLVVSWSLRVRCRLFCNSTYMLFTYISPPRNKQPRLFVNKSKHFH